MYQYIIGGNILTHDEPPLHIICNTVNCDGYMGKGLALSFKQYYHDTNMFAQYRCHCRSGNSSLKPGMVLRWYDNGQYASNPDRWVLHCATKDNTWQPSRIEWIEGILDRLVDKLTNHLDEFILPKGAHYPSRLGVVPFGCGNGGLSWDTVGPLMRQRLETIPNMDVYCFINKGKQQY